MILAAPPAAAMTYVNDSRGLDPSVYGGGGSSSDPLPDGSPLFSPGNAAFVSATTEGAAGAIAEVGRSSNGGAGANAGRLGALHSVIEGL